MTFGHEFTGMVEQLGEDVENLKIGGHFLVPFNIACGTCRILSRDSMAIATNPPPGHGSARHLRLFVWRVQGVQTPTHA